MRKKLFDFLKSMIYATIFFSCLAFSISKIDLTPGINDLFIHIQNRLLLVIYISIFIIFILSIWHQIKQLNQSSKGLLAIISFDQLFFVSVTIIFCISCCLGNTNRELFVLAILTLLSWPLNHKIIVLESLISQVIVVIVVAFLLIAGINVDFVYIGHGVTHSLGFLHANCVGMTFFAIITSAWLFCEYTKPFSKKALIICSLLSIILASLVYHFSRCRTFYISIIMFIVLYNISNMFKNSLVLKMENGFLKYFISLFPLICFVFSIVLGYLLDHFQLHFSNFDIRFSDGIRALYTHGLSCFGIADYSPFVIDHNYYKIILQAGVIVLCCYILFCIRSFQKAYQKRDISFLVFLLTLHFYLMMEAYFHLWTVVFIEFSYAFCNSRNDISLKSTKA